MTRYREKLLEWTFIGYVDYKYGLRLQSKFYKFLSKSDSDLKGYIIFLEHKPVITIGRFGDFKNVLVSEKVLKRMGVDVFRTDRGGDVTFHGPGQLVVYPIIRLKDFGLGVRSYVHLIEDSLISVLKKLGIEAKRRVKRPGVWVGMNKIAAIGIKIRHHISMHGFSLNVNNDLDYYSLIVPCGLKNLGVTSIRNALNSDFSLMMVASSIAEEFGRKLDARMEYLCNINSSTAVSRSILHRPN